MNQLKEYLWMIFKMNNIPKYYKYFEEWISNLTENQIVYYTAYMNNNKSPWV